MRRGNDTSAKLMIRSIGVRLITGLLVVISFWNIWQFDRRAADLPSRNPAKRTLLRARAPDGWRITGAKIDATELAVDPKGSVDLSGKTGPVIVTFSVAK